MSAKEAKTTSISEEELQALLYTHNIPLKEWGTGKAKTIQHLLSEVINRECQLIEEDGQLLRLVEVASVDVYFEDEEGKKYRLVEDRQEFKDGRTRKRSFDWSVSEKMSPNEESLKGAQRALSEELGIDGEVSITEEAVIKDIKTSPSYPGLTSKYKRHHFITTLDRNQFNSDGYVEEQSDKTTYFVWQELE